MSDLRKKKQNKQFLISDGNICTEVTQLIEHSRTFWILSIIASKENVLGADTIIP